MALSNNKKYFFYNFISKKYIFKIPSLQKGVIKV